MAYLPSPALDLAAEQFGIVTRRDLLELGATRGQITNWLRHGALERVHQGVYRIGGTQMVREQEHYAALRRGGPNARTGGSSALAFLAVEGFMFDDTPFVVVEEGRVLENVPFTWLGAPVPQGDLASLPGGIPGVTPARALVEAAGVVEENRVRVGYDDLRRRKMVSQPRLVACAHAALDTVPGARRMLEIAGSGALDKESEGERRLSTVFLPTDPWPLWQVWVLGNIRLDALYPEARLALEYHGRRFHSIGEDRERDRARAERLECEADIKTLEVWKEDLADPAALRARILGERAERLRAGIPPLRKFRLQH